MRTRYSTNSSSPPCPLDWRSGTVSAGVAGRRSPRSLFISGAQSMAHDPMIDTLNDPHFPLIVAAYRDIDKILARHFCVVIAPLSRQVAITTTRKSRHVLVALSRFCMGLAIHSDQVWPQFSCVLECGSPHVLHESRHDYVAIVAIWVIVSHAPRAGGSAPRGPCHRR